MDLSHYIRPVPIKPAERNDDSAASTGKIDLSPDAVKLMSLLGATARPTRLQALFPHVLNRLAGVWHQPARFEPEMEELLLSTRDNRAGFPLEIVAELTALREYYRTALHPQKNDPWSSVRVRS
jgi:hypothetical protein